MNNLNASLLMTTAQRAVSSYANWQFPRFFYKEELEDIAGELTYKLLRSIDNFDPEKGSMENWIFSSARNAVRSAAEQKSRRRGLITNCEGLRSDDFEQDDLARKETEELMRECLSGRNRQIFDLRVMGYESGEIAKILNITPTAAYMAIFHMRDKIRKAA